MNTLVALLAGPFCVRKASLFTMDRPQEEEHQVVAAPPPRRASRSRSRSPTLDLNGRQRPETPAERDRRYNRNLNIRVNRIVREQFPWKTRSATDVLQFDGLTLRETIRRDLQEIDDIARPTLMTPAYFRDFDFRFRLENVMLDPEQVQSSRTVAKVNMEKII